MFYFGFSHSVNHLMCTSDRTVGPTAGRIGRARVDRRYAGDGRGRGLRGPRQGREDRGRGRAVHR